MMCCMEWRTERLVITPLAQADAAELFACLDDPRVGTYLGGPDVQSLPWLEERIEHLLAGPADASQEWLNFVMRLPDGRVVGRLEATVSGDWAEVAWVLGPPFWRQGLGTEGARWLVAHLEGECGITELWATVDPRNEASLALLRRLGFSARSSPWARAVESYDDGDVVMARLDAVDRQEQA
jgi:RimJ/RimL family protein N-acetyltransferase